MNKQKLLLLSLLCMVILLLSIGCSGGGQSEPTQYIGYFEEDPGPTQELCCGTQYTSNISGVAPAGGAYYWSALMMSDTMVIYGEPVYVPAGSFDSVQVDLVVSYLDKIPADDYSVLVLASDSIEQVGDLSSQLNAADYGFREVLNYADSVCSSCCTDTTNGGLNRYKAFAVKGLNDVIGVSADIQTRYGRLCGAETPTANGTAAQQTCFTGIMVHADYRLGQPLQAQVGWSHFRDTTGFIDTVIYWELTTVSGPPAVHARITFGPEDNVTIPGDGDFHNYEVVRDDDTTISFYYDGGLLHTLKVLQFSGAVMTIGTWQGEIGGRETDMPGTQQNPCFFYACKYTLNNGQGPQWAAFDNSLPTDTLDVTPLKDTGPNEWAIFFSIGSSNFAIWDVIPFTP